jgi:transcriptional regulator GlxA family with amidase domain
MEHIPESFTVKRLAEAAGMSARTSRVFVQEAKVTSADFMERARVDAAHNLLETRDMILKEIAYQYGFGSPDRIRIVFIKHLAMTPIQYRANFRPQG